MGELLRDAIWALIELVVWGPPGRHTLTATHRPEGSDATAVPARADDPREHGRAAP
jgi:hypothetical protein